MRCHLQTKPTKPTPGHCKFARLCVTIKILEALKFPNGQEEGLKIATQRDPKVTPTKCHIIVIVTEMILCVVAEHFNMEPKATIVIRISHQNGTTLKQLDAIPKPARRKPARRILGDHAPACWAGIKGSSWKRRTVCGVAQATY